jgi:hypothetical protein
MIGSNEILQAILSLHRATEAGFLRLGRLEKRFDALETRFTRFEIA